MKCLLFGLGQAGMAALAYLRERGADVVGVYSRTSYVGEDIGLLLGQAPAGLTVLPVSEFSAREGMADIALFFTTSTIEDLLGEPLACLEQGINVLTIAEQALFPWSFMPDIAARLDDAARRNGCSLVATGVNDTVMCHLPAIVAGIAPRAERISIEIAGNFGVLGPATLAALPLGLTGDEFNALPHDDSESAPSICGQVAEALAAMAGLELASLAIAAEATFTQSDIAAPTIGRTIGAGLTSGIAEIASAQTTAGIAIEVRLYGKLFEPHDEEYLTVEIAGPVPLKLDLRPLPSIETTAAIAVGRAPDVIAAPPGFITMDRLPTAILRSCAAYR